jgi:hypothetical protein
MHGITATALTARQRSTPPAGDGTARRNESRGGWAPGGRPRTLAPGMVDELARYPGTTFDRGLRYDRTPWYPRDYYIPPANSWVNWTAAGPQRAELAMRALPAIRLMVGNSQSRAFADPANPQRGLHTNPAVGVTRTAPRYVDTPQMRPGRQDRLTRASYAGQSYSQTTRMQGGRRG